MPMKYEKFPPSHFHLWIATSDSEPIWSRTGGAVVLELNPNDEEIALDITCFYIRVSAEKALDEFEIKS